MECYKGCTRHCSSRAHLETINWLTQSARLKNKHITRFFEFEGILWVWYTLISCWFGIHPEQFKQFITANIKGGCRWLLRSQTWHIFWKEPSSDTEGSIFSELDTSQSLVYFESPFFRLPFFGGSKKYLNPVKAGWMGWVVSPGFLGVQNFLEEVHTQQRWRPPPEAWMEVENGLGFWLESFTIRGHFPLNHDDGRKDAPPDNSHGS